MKYLFIFICFCIHYLSFSQISIGNLNPHQHAQLDVSDSKKGILIPRVALQAQTSPQPISSDPSTLPESLLVYNTNATTVLDRAYYYWSGAQWNKVATKAELDILTANNGITRTDNIFSLGGDLIKPTIITSTATNGMSIRGGSANFFNVTNTGAATTILSVNGANNRVGIGTTTPSAKLEVNGDVRISGTLAESDGTPLVIDANGFIKKQKITLAPLQRVTYTTTSILPNNSFEINLSIDPTTTMFIVQTGNACSRRVITTFITNINVLSYIGGQARDILYTYDVLDPDGSEGSLKTFSAIIGCSDGGGATQFNFDIKKQTNKLIIINRGNIGRTYTVIQKEL